MSRLNVGDKVRVLKDVTHHMIPSGEIVKVLEVLKDKFGEYYLVEHIEEQKSRKRYITLDEVELIENYTLSSKGIEDIVNITVEEYERLLDDSNFLSCLHACGVDNWEGYGDAIEMWREEE